MEHEDAWVEHGKILAVKAFVAASGCEISRDILLSMLDAGDGEDLSASAKIMDLKSKILQIESVANDRLATIEELRLISSEQVAAINGLEQKVRELSRLLDSKEEPEEVILDEIDPFGKGDTTAEAAIRNIENEEVKKDWDKAQALRNAGWSLQRIADEIRCSCQTVANHTHKPSEDERSGKKKPLEEFG